MRAHTRDRKPSIIFDLSKWKGMRGGRETAAAKLAGKPQDYWSSGVGLEIRRLTSVWETRLLMHTLSLLRDPRNRMINAVENLRIRHPVCGTNVASSSLTVLSDCSIRYARCLQNASRILAEKKHTPVKKYAKYGRTRRLESRKPSSPTVVDT